MAPVQSVEQLRKEFLFVENLLKTAVSVNQYVAAANAAARIANRTAAALESQPRSKPTDASEPKAPPAAGSSASGGSEFVTLRGLPVGNDWNWTRVRKYLTDMGLAPKHVEKKAGQDFAFVAFKCGPDLDDALAKLATRDDVTASRGKDVELAQSGKKRGAESQGGRLPGKVSRGEGVCDAVCQWWRRPYGDQLRDKAAKVVAALKHVTTELSPRFPTPKPAWLEVATSGASVGPAVPLEGILRAPQFEHYRNKCEFTIGLDGEDQARVGFLLGSFADGVTMTCDPEPARHTSRLAVQYAQMTTDFIREQSALPAYDKRKKSQQGFWRLLTVREGRHSTHFPGHTGSRTFDEFDPWQYLVTCGTTAADTAVQAEQGNNAGPAITSEEPGSLAAAPRGVPVAQFQEPPSCADVPHADEVLLVIQVTDTFAPAPQLHAEVAKLTAHLRETSAARGLPLTTVCLQLHHGISNAAAYDAPISVVYSAPAAVTATATAAATATPATPEAAGPVASTSGADAPNAGPGAAAAGGTAGTSGTAGAADGSGFIHDALLDLKFRISATAFFQVNSAATCVLYKVVGEWAATRPSTLLLDVCCGTGTIGLTLARKVSKVIGIDNVAESIRDAAANAQLNGITNCEFMCAKAEDVLSQVLAKHAGSYEDVVAVLDPPRCGCHKTAIAALLRCPQLRRIVYVSCNPDSLAINMEQLCAPGSNRGGPAWEAFRPVRAVAVDLFPHTPHVESVVLMER